MASWGLVLRLGSRPAERRLPPIWGCFSATATQAWSFAPQSERESCFPSSSDSRGCRNKAKGPQTHHGRCLLIHAAPQVWKKSLKLTYFYWLFRCLLVQFGLFGWSIFLSACQGKVNVQPWCLHARLQHFEAFTCSGFSICFSGPDNKNATTSQTCLQCQFCIIYQELGNNGECWVINF